MAHVEDATDPYLPLMIWYGVEPLVTADKAATLSLTSKANIPLLRRFIARRDLDVDEPQTEPVVRLAMRTSNENVRLDLLHGMLDALEARGKQPVPPSWDALYLQVASSSNSILRSIPVRLATIFGDQKAIVKLRQTALDGVAPTHDRRDSFRVLLKLDDGEPVSMLHELASESSILRRDAIQALALRNDTSTAAVLLGGYADFDPAERQDAIGVLGTQRNFAAALLTAIENDVVSRRDVSAFALGQLRAFQDAGLMKRIDAL